MKYKKLLVFITCLLFVTVAVFCLASAFKVTDIELQVESVENSSEDISALCEEELLNSKDANLIFLDVDKIKGNLSALSGYIDVVEVKKVFPNKIFVSVKERIEEYSVLVNDKIYALDGDFCVLSEKQSHQNNVTGVDNLLIDIPYSDFNQNLVVGKKIEIYDKVTASYLQTSSSFITSVKDSVESVSITVKKDGVYYRTLTLKMKEGVTFNILKADEQILEKLQVTYTFYSSLENKGVGEYITVLEDGGNITVKQ